MLDIEDLIDFSHTKANKFFCDQVTFSREVNLLTPNETVSSKKAVKNSKGMADIFLDFLMNTPDTPVSFLKAAITQEVDFMQACLANRNEWENGNDGYVDDDDIEQITMKGSVKKRLLLRAAQMNMSLAEVMAPKQNLAKPR